VLDEDIAKINRFCEDKRAELLARISSVDHAPPGPPDEPASPASSSGSAHAHGHAHHKRKGGDDKGQKKKRKHEQREREQALLQQQLQAQRQTQHSLQQQAGQVPPRPRRIEPALSRHGGAQGTDVREAASPVLSSSPLLVRIDNPLVGVAPPPGANFADLPTDASYVACARLPRR
jgi:hypothetical protein